jgi:light-regulated signal transduction histidine kinase (bacteriophytochrome)
VINDVLDFSKIEAGKLELHPATSICCRWWTRSVRVWPLPPQQGAGAVDRHRRCGAAVRHGDGARLRQVLINLVGNAIKFTDSGSIVVSVARSDEQRFRFAVQDTGIGLAAAEERARVFDCLCPGRRLAIPAGMAEPGWAWRFPEADRHADGGEIGVDSTARARARRSGSSCSLPASAAEPATPAADPLASPAAAPARARAAGRGQRRQSTGRAGLPAAFRLAGQPRQGMVAKPSEHRSSSPSISS